MTLLIIILIILLLLFHSGHIRKKSSFFSLHAFILSVSQHILAISKLYFSRFSVENKAFRGTEDIIFLQIHMIPEDNNTCFVKNYLWMPFWMAVKFLTQVPLQCPRSFWKLLISVPMSNHSNPGSKAAAMPTTLCGEKGAWAPRNVSLGLSQDPRELHGGHWRTSLPLIHLQTQSPLPKPPHTDVLYIREDQINDVLHISTYQSLPHFFLRFLCNFLSRLQQDKILWVYSP